MLPALAVSEAVGYATTSNPRYIFDDLKDVGLWPAHEYIKKVISISVWIGAARPNGIEITYQLSNTTQPRVQMHGQRNGAQRTVTVAENEIFVGMFGAVDSDPDQPTLRRLGFLVYNKDTGALAQQGPFPGASVTTENIAGFASLGLIIGFSGTCADNGHLDTVAVYKLQPGGTFSLDVIRFPANIPT